MVCTHEITCMHVVSSGAKHGWRCSILVQGLKRWFTHNAHSKLVLFIMLYYPETIFV